MISHWEVDALSNIRILAMSTSERCSLLHHTAGGSVIVVEIDVDIWVGQRIILEFDQVAAFT